MTIHETAIIDASATIADDVTIGPYCVIGADVHIGKGTTLAAHVVVNGPTRIGEDNHIHEFAAIGGNAQALKVSTEPTYLEIGDRNIIRESATMNRGTTEGGGVTRIGSDNYFMAFTHVGHDCQVGSHIVFTHGTTLGGHVEVGDYANLGGFTIVHQFVRLGTHCFTAGGSAVSRDIPPYVTVAGDIASAYGINKEGLRRRGKSSECIRALHKAYMTLIRSRQPRQLAMVAVKPLTNEFEEVRTLVDFIQSSKRGIVRSK